jgi:hypothetical protein
MIDGDALENRDQSVSETSLILHPLKPSDLLTRIIGIFFLFHDLVW